MEPETLYKLMVMYMLKKVNFPLSNPQLWTFFQEKGYTNFFTYQATMQGLLDANLVFSDEVGSTVRYELTKEGEDALYYFKNDISPEVRSDMDAFITENQFQLRNETGITADYYKTTNFDYEVDLKVREGENILFELKLSVPTEEQAKVLADHFPENAESIYSMVLKRLM